MPTTEPPGARQAAQAKPRSRPAAQPPRPAREQGAEHPGAEHTGAEHEHGRDLTVTIPLDRAAELVAAPVSAAGRVLSSRGGLPVYVGLAVMAAADVIAWPVAAAAGLGYAVLRKWGPADHTHPLGAHQGAADHPGA